MGSYSFYYMMFNNHVHLISNDSIILRLEPLHGIIAGHTVGGSNTWRMSLLELKCYKLLGKEVYNNHTT